MKLQELKRGDHGPRVKDFQHSLNRRLKARDLDGWTVDPDGKLGPKTLRGARKAAWALGALPKTYNAITKTGHVPLGVVRMIRNPGKRNDGQLRRARARMSHLRALRKKRADELARSSKLRRAIVDGAMQAKANYMRDPAAYHYLAGGVANLIFLEPSPDSYRSDCSQFGASAYDHAGAPSPGTVEHKWISTYTMAAAVKTGLARVVDKAHRKPGDLGMYGTLEAPHHVEIVCLRPGAEFVGHGSPPIDSLTPGEPNYYLTFDFLD